MRWASSLASLPGALLALLPSVSCPACLAAYTGLLSSVGLGSLHEERVLAPLIVLFLACSVASVGFSSRGDRHRGPFMGTVAAAAAGVLGRFVVNIPVMVYLGALALVGASLWNLWLKRPERACPRSA